MAKAKVAAVERKISFGKRRLGKAKNLNTPKGKKVSKYRGQGK